MAILKSLFRGGHPAGPASGSAETETLAAAGESALEIRGMEPKKVLVIGTSNSIVRGGWYDGLREALQAHDPACSIERIAMGGAPFSQFLGVAEEVATADYDVVVVDTSPNDETYHDSVGSLPLFCNLYRDFVDILTTRASVIVLRLPPKSAAGRLTQIARLQQAICNQFGARYFDAAADLDAIASELGVALYRDRYHPQTSVAFRLGGVLGDQILSAPVTPRPTSRFALGRYEEFTDHGGGKPTVEIANSLVTQRFTIFGLDAIHRFPVPVFLLGMHIMSERTNTVLRLTGVRGETRDIHWFYRGVPRVGKIQFVPLTGGHLVSSISVVRPWHSFQRGLHSYSAEAPFELAVSKMLIHRIE